MHLDKVAEGQQAAMDVWPSLSRCINLFPSLRGQILETGYYINNNSCTCLFSTKYSKLVNEPEHLGKILDIGLDVLFQLKATKETM